MSSPPSIKKDLPRLLELKGISDGQRAIFDLEVELAEHGFGIERNNEPSPS